MVGNGNKATLPGGKKIDDYKKNQSINNENKLTNNSNEKKDDKGNGENKKSNADNLGQNVASEATKKALKASFPYIPQFVINKLVDSNLGQKVIESTLNKTKRKMIFMLVATAGSTVFTLAIIAGFFALILGPVAWLADVVGGVADFFKSLGNWIIGKGWCPTEEECQNKAYTEYYEDLKEKANKYNKDASCKINEDLITATLFYGQMVDSKKQESEEDLNGNNKYYDYLDVKSNAAGNQHAKDEIDGLIRAYSGKDYDSEDDEEDKINPCNFNQNSYENFLINKYIPGAYKDVLDANNVSVKKAAEEIMEIGNILMIRRAFSTSTYCKAIVVENDDGSTETMDLEEYVARVVTKENSWYEGTNIENMKAQAVAARTYGLYQTNNCQGPIHNGTGKQAVAATAIDQAVQAASETNSMVLTKEGKTFSTEYDALAIASSDDKNYYLKQANLAIEKTWLDSHVTQSQYDYYAKHNHGRGMSQWGSRYLQHTGKNYEQILNTFYSGAELVKMGGLIAGGNYSSNIGPAASVTELKQRADEYAGNLDIYSSKTGLISQCSWYAKSRAIEIVYGSNMDDQLKQTAINSLKATNGNGGSWYANPDAKVFTKSTDYTQPQPGSIVSWSANCSSGKNYGHVAIIEQVNADGTVLMSESWNSAGAEAANNWSNVTYRVTTQTLDYIKSHKGSCQFTFNGYVYLLN